MIVVSSFLRGSLYFKNFDPSRQDVRGWSPIQFLTSPSPVTFTLSLKIESNYRTTNSLGATNRCRFHILYRYKFRSRFRLRFGRRRWFCIGLNTNTRVKGQVLCFLWNTFWCWQGLNNLALRHKVLRGYCRLLTVRIVHMRVVRACLE